MPYSIRLSTDTLVQPDLGAGKSANPKSENKMSAGGKSLEEYESAGKVSQTQTVGLDDLDGELAKRNKFLKFGANETRILEFLKGANGKISVDIVDGEYQGQPNTRLHYKVKEPKVSTTDEKIFAVSRKHAEQLNLLLKKGKTLIEVTRKGTGRNDTQYLYTPAD